MNALFDMLKEEFPEPARCESPKCGHHFMMDDGVYICSHCFVIEYGITDTAILGLLKRRGIKIRKNSDYKAK